MITEIQPNRLYTMYQVFGDALFEVDKLTLVPGGINTIHDHTWLRETKFKGSSFSVFLGGTIFSLDNLRQDAFGDTIYFPVEEPVYHNILAIAERPLREQPYNTPQIGRFRDLSFTIQPALEEDMVGEAYTERKKIGQNGKTVEERVRQYRYSLLLRSPKGTFISEERAILDKDSGEYNVNFVEWRPSNTNGRAGNLYVPAEYRKLGSLEIMLQEK